MKLLRNLFIILGTVALGGCTVFDSFSEVNALNEVQPAGSPFTQVLAEEYRAFSNNELREMFDYPDALHFARKGLAAAAGNPVMPEPVSDWNLERMQIEEINAARGRLLVVYDLGARETVPTKAAIAQARYDCWIEQAEEEDQDANACRGDFLKLISELEAEVQPPPEAEIIEEPEIMEPVEPIRTEPSEPLAPEDAVYLVFFNWDSSKLTPAAFNVLDAVSEEISQNPPETINVVGHADTSGSEEYNKRLSFRRAVVVRDALVERGVSESLLKIDSRGETELLVPTPDNVREPANRRTVISFE